MNTSKESICELECKYGQITGCGKEWKEMENTIERLRDVDVGEMIHHQFIGISERKREGMEGDNTHSDWHFQLSHFQNCSKMWILRFKKPGEFKEGKIKIPESLLKLQNSETKKRRQRQAERNKDYLQVNFDSETTSALERALASIK